ncbi:hypothetical protein B1218_36115, partial [Pseudomonas ogarae]
TAREGGGVGDVRRVACGLGAVVGGGRGWEVVDGGWTTGGREVTSESGCGAWGRGRRGGGKVAVGVGTWYAWREKAGVSRSEGLA